MSNIKQKTVFDYPSEKRLDNNKKIKKLTGSEALENAIIIWLTSQEGDYIRNPFKGGYIVPYLMKPMTQERANAIYDAILIGLSLDFDVNFIVQSVSVIPDYQNRVWQITITGYSVDVKENLTLDTRLKNII